MKKIIFLLFFLTPLALSADGGMIPYEAVSLNETDQEALIYYGDGQEDLYLNVQYMGETNKFAWVIPLPSLPDAELSNERLFRELADLFYYYGEENTWRDKLNSDFGLGGVTVHSNEQLGIYNIAVLSATGGDGLMEWFLEHGYNVQVEAKEILNFYIDKDWYFVAIKIDPEEQFKKILENFKKINAQTTEYSFYENFLDYTLSALKQGDYNKILNISRDVPGFVGVNSSTYYANGLLTELANSSFSEISEYIESKKEEASAWQDIEVSLREDILQKLYSMRPDLKRKIILDEIKKLDSSASMDNLADSCADAIIDVMNNEDYERFLKVMDLVVAIMPTDGEYYSEEEYKEMVIDNDFSNYSDGEERQSYVDLIAEFMEEPASFSGNLDPIKISFKTDEIIYPLKISQISANGSNHIRVHAISQDRLMQDELREEKAFEIKKSDLDESTYPYLREILGEGSYWYARFDAYIKKEDMNDLVFVNYVAQEVATTSGTTAPSSVSRKNNLDSDAGWDYFEKGSYTKPDNIEIVDKCLNENDLQEIFVGESGFVQYRQVECLGGCFEGACKKVDASQCIETDNGRDFYNKGETCVLDSSGKEIKCFTEKCGTANGLYEYYCSRNQGEIVVDRIVRRCSGSCGEGRCLDIEDELENINDSGWSLMTNNRQYFVMRNSIKIDENKEERVYEQYLEEFVEKNQENLNDRFRNSLKIFVSYGVDDNTISLGEGERAAVVNSYFLAYNKFPEDEFELSDMVKIANGRWPDKKSEPAERRAKESFMKIYKRIPDMKNKNDSAAVTIMAYGLRQSAQNRNLESEARALDMFKLIYKHNPVSTEDWNALQAITYSGASRKPDSDVDFLSDDMELEYGTDASNPDSDGDSFLDGIEILNGYNPKGQGKLVD